ncbi:MAG: NHL repeat-containing protein [Microscillaceae bacterium]
MMFSNPEPLLEQAIILQGSAAYPLLAPRGVCLAGGHLLVSDTGQNRVFIWKNIAHRPSQSAPDLVLGQSDAAQTGRNAGAQAGPDTLQYPSGIWSDGARLIVADAWNHRVLIWHQWPTQNGQAADVVLGQPDFAQNQPNVKGLAHPPSAQSLYWCYGVFSDGQHLWIADTGNRRVLYFDQIPTRSYTPADRVIGQPQFNTRDYDPQNALWPYSVRVSPDGKMAIADTQYYRVLLWHRASEAFQKPADRILGQADFEQNGQNQYLPHPEAHTLSWCYDTFFYREGLLVADTGNSRLLFYPELPPQSGAPAQKVLGKPDFRTGSENEASKTSTVHSLYWPFSLSIDGGLLAIADTGNHRVILSKINTLGLDTQS